MSQTDLIALKATPIAVADPPLLNAAGLHAPYALRIIIELQTKGGTWGISEIPGSKSILDILPAIGEHIYGLDAFQFNLIRNAIDNFFGEQAPDPRGNKPWDQRRITHVISALEVACLDIQGKEQGRRVVDLLGGAFRERVPFAAYLFYKYPGAGGPLGFGTDLKATGWAAARQASALTPHEIVQQAQVMCREFGFQSIKLKGGAFEPEAEVAAIRALAKAFGPRVPLRLDPNAIWSIETALLWGKKLEGLLEYFEDPVRGQEAMALLKKKLNTPLATNMCTTSFSEIRRSIELESEDIILCDHHFWGGIQACIDLYKMSRVFDRKISMHSNSHLGISLAAMVHLGAALPTIDYALDTHYPWQAEEIIRGGKLPIEDGFVTVPKGPGLGVEIDQEALAVLHQNYLNCGLTERNDELEMQKINPDWRFQLTRW